MTVMTNELRVALRNFKEKINALNFTIDFKEPPFPVGSIECYEAKLDLANEYLKKYPELNGEEFNVLGLPLYVKSDAIRHIRQQKFLAKQEDKGSSTMRATPEQIMEALFDAAKDEFMATAAMMALMAHVNDYKINDLIEALIECGVLKLNENQQEEG